MATAYQTRHKQRGQWSRWKSIFAPAEWIVLGLKGRETRNKVTVQRDAAGMKRQWRVKP